MNHSLAGDLGPGLGRLHRRTTALTGVGGRVGNIHSARCGQSPSRRTQHQMPRASQVTVTSGPGSHPPDHSQALGDWDCFLFLCLRLDQCMTHGAGTHSDQECRPALYQLPIRPRAVPSACPSPRPLLLTGPCGEIKTVRHLQR